MFLHRNNPTMVLGCERNLSTGDNELFKMDLSMNKIVRHFFGMQVGRYDMIGYKAAKISNKRNINLNQYT